MTDDPYLSHPVRRLREDPVAGETVRLVVDVTDTEAVRERVRDLDGEVVEALRFADLRVELPHSAVDEFCALDGLDRVETDDVLGLGIED